MHDAIEIEAESVSYMVAARLGLETSSDAYLAGFAKDSKIPEGVSLDLIAKVAGRITEMGERLLPERKRRKVDGAEGLTRDDPGAVENLRFKYNSSLRLVGADR